jgi:ferritin-like metal-binding protein YciE
MRPESAPPNPDHYEIASYGTICEFAKLFDEPTHVSLLGETLEEEKQTGETLTQL